MKKGPLTPKGFRDILPDSAKKRRKTVNTICDVLESYGFQPLETPTIEFANTLLGKYGGEERLIYRFKDRGGRYLALRFDLTVPLARFVANNLGLLQPSFSRYQVGQVFRGENPQKGRFREFTQLDFDTVGSNQDEDDAKIVAAAIKSVRKIGLDKACMQINDRNRFKNIPENVIRFLDKLDKIEKPEVISELEKKGYQDNQINNFLDQAQNTPPTGKLNNIFTILNSKYGLTEGKDYAFSRLLARGLDYYTSTIFELKPDQNEKNLSIGGGGRYDDLIGMFAGRQIPAVGFSFGLDRILDITKLPS